MPRLTCDWTAAEQVLANFTLPKRSSSSSRLKGEEAHEEREKDGYAFHDSLIICGI